MPVIYDYFIILLAVAGLGVYSIYTMVVQPIIQKFKDEEEREKIQSLRNCLVSDDEDVGFDTMIADQNVKSLIYDKEISSMRKILEGCYPDGVPPSFESVISEDRHGELLYMLIKTLYLSEVGFVPAVVFDGFFPNAPSDSTETTVVLSFCAVVENNLIRHWSNANPAIDVRFYSPVNCFVSRALCLKKKHDISLLSPEARKWRDYVRVPENCTTSR